MPWVPSSDGIRDGPGLSTERPRQLSEGYRILTIGLCYQVTVDNRAELLPSDRGWRYQVTVDNPAYPACYPEGGRALAPRMKP
jgi:hypothetical protein